MSDELVAKWRNTELPSGHSAQWEDGFLAASNNCADQLESALQQQGEAVGAVQWLEGLLLDDEGRFIYSASFIIANIRALTHPPKPVVSADLVQAARDFYNMTVADPEVRITTKDKNKRDWIAAEADRLRGLLAQLAKEPT